MPDNGTDELPATVAELAQRHGFGRHAFSHQQGVGGSGCLLLSVAVFLGAAGIVVFVVFVPSLAAVIVALAMLLSSVLLGWTGVWFSRTQYDRQPVLYCFGGGVVRRDGDGRLLACSWPQISARIHETQDLPPWGTGTTLMSLSSTDGTPLGTVTGSETCRRITGLMHG